MWLDADTIVCRPLDPLFNALEAASSGSLLAACEGNNGGQVGACNSHALSDPARLLDWSPGARTR